MKSTRYSPPGFIDFFPSCIHHTKFFYTTIYLVISWHIRQTLLRTTNITIGYLYINFEQNQFNTIPKSTPAHKENKSNYTARFYNNNNMVIDEQFTIIISKR